MDRECSYLLEPAQYSSVNGACPTEIGGRCFRCGNNLRWSLSQGRLDVLQIAIKEEVFINQLLFPFSINPQANTCQLEHNKFKIEINIRILKFLYNKSRYSHEKRKETIKRITKYQRRIPGIPSE